MKPQRLISLILALPLSACSTAPQKAETLLSPYLAQCGRGMFSYLYHTANL